MWQNPDRSYPLWDKQRALQTVVEMLTMGTLSGENIVTPIVRFDDTPRQLSGIFARPDDAIKVGVRLPSG